MDHDGDARLGGCHTFSCHVGVQPERVWAALTDGRARDHLYGLALLSTWEPGADIRVLHADRQAWLTGRVLCVHRGERLSYMLAPAEGDPPVYVTWLIRPAPAGSTVRLEIDEVEGADSAEAAEDVWLPVLAALQKQLGGR